MCLQYFDISSNFNFSFHQVPATSLDDDSITWARFLFLLKPVWKLLVVNDQVYIIISYKLKPLPHVSFLISKLICGFPPLSRFAREDYLFYLKT